ARVSRIREESAVFQTSFEFFDAKQRLLDERREFVDRRLLLLAEKRQREVLRLGANPRRRRKTRLYPRDAFVRFPNHRVGKPRGDEEAHVVERETAPEILPLVIPSPAEGEGSPAQMRWCLVFAMGIRRRLRGSE